MSEHTYSVYLVQGVGEQGGEREVTSPVRGHDVEFYETGVWLDRDAGRNFFPYRQVRTVREHPAGGVSETEGEAHDEADAESEASTGSENAPSERTDAVDSSDVGNAGDSPGDGNAGAEEEMLED